MLKEDFYIQYTNAFNAYVLQILYGGNILMGSDIENKNKDD